MIFSRKGFDSSAGGFPSPIIDGMPRSLPIPTRMASTDCFGDLREPLASIIEYHSRGKFSRTTACHIDPDIDRTMKRRAPGWRGSLGQVSRAQTHLQNNDVQQGDLFLFFGLFQEHQSAAGQHRFVGGRKHMLFGWLQVGEVILLGRDGRHVLRTKPWLEGHPHVSEGWSDNNTLYVASENLSLGSDELSLSGFGVFPQGRDMTDPLSEKPSVWSVPDWINPRKGGVGMTFHRDPQNWSDRTVRSAGRGQEFVADITHRVDAIEWLVQLFRREA